MRSVMALGEGMKLLSLGLDYRRYAKFRLLAPTPGRPDATKGRPWPPSPDACRFCFDFVVESALRLQEVVIEPI